MLSLHLQMKYPIGDPKINEFQLFQRAISGSSGFVQNCCPQILAAPLEVQVGLRRGTLRPQGAYWLLWLWLCPLSLPSSLLLLCPPLGWRTCWPTGEIVGHEMSTLPRNPCCSHPKDDLGAFMCPIEKGCQSWLLTQIDQSNNGGITPVEVLRVTLTPGNPRWHRYIERSSKDDSKHIELNGCGFTPCKPVNVQLRMAVHTVFWGKFWRWFTTFFVISHMMKGQFLANWGSYHRKSGMAIYYLLLGLPHEWFFPYRLCYRHLSKPCLRALRHRMFRQLSRQEEPEAGELKPENKWVFTAPKKLDMEPLSWSEISFQTSCSCSCKVLQTFNWGLATHGFVQKTNQFMGTEQDMCKYVCMNVWMDGDG